ncbi:MAG: flagellin FliC [Candidatus Accumulibacter sp.]|jgi:flagellin|nr:flagellin FliC [Accumulibacter sp.]
MSQVINTNIMSLNSQRNLNKSQSALSTSLERLSSGLRINSAMDDAAGLAVAQKMESQIRGMTVAQRNASDGISYAQTADTALSTVTDQLQRMRELATQSLNGTISDSERSKINEEFSALQSEASRIQTAAKINDQPVFGSFTFQVGANAGDTITGTFNSINISGANVSTTGGASAALAQIDSWLGDAATNRAQIGGIQSRLTFTVSYLEGAVENQTAAKSRIMDADFASETASMTRAQILQQAGVAMVSQANSVPQNVLSLIR